MGRGGKQVAQLEKDHQVTIQLPKDQHSDVIEIKGAVENCEDAKQAIMKLVENQTLVVIQVS